MISMIMGPEDYERFLYGDESFDALADERIQIWIKSVEDALGFKLFAWQKMMLMGMTREYGRRTGKSTTWALQKLSGKLPIDMSREAMMRRSHREIFNYRLLKEIAEKLDENGIPHAKICGTKNEWNEAMEELSKNAKNDGKYIDRVIIDEFTLPDSV